MTLTLRSLKSTSITYSTPHADRATHRSVRIVHYLNFSSPHPNHMHAQSIHDAFNTSGPAARNVRARVSSEVGWSTCMPSAGSAARRVRRRRWLRRLLVGCLPRQRQQVHTLPTPRSGRGCAQLPSPILPAAGRRQPSLPRKYIYH